MSESCRMIDPSTTWNGISEAGRCISVRDDIKATDEVLSDGGRSFLFRIVGTSLTQ